MQERLSTGERVKTNHTRFETQPSEYEAQLISEMGSTYPAIAFTDDGRKLEQKINRYEETMRLIPNGILSSESILDGNEKGIIEVLFETNSLQSIKEFYVILLNTQSENLREEVRLRLITSTLKSVFIPKPLSTFTNLHTELL